MITNQPPSPLSGEIKLNFSQAEGILLKSHLTYAADRLQTEIEKVRSRVNMTCTFRQTARLLRWQRYFTLLVCLLQPGHNPFDPLDVNLSSLSRSKFHAPRGSVTPERRSQTGLEQYKLDLLSLLTREADPFLDFLRSERYRAEAAVSYIREKPLDDLSKQEMLRALAIEARFYGDLIDHIATPRQPCWQPDDAWVPLLFISLPKTLR